MRPTSVTRTLLALAATLGTAFAQNDLASRLKALHDGTTPGIGGQPAASQGAGSQPATKPPPTFPHITPAEEAAAPKIEFVAGLLFVAAINNPVFGDYEVIDTVAAAGESGVRWEYSAQLPDASGQTKEPKRVKGAKFDRQQDILHASGVVNYFGNGIPEQIPGTTSQQFSRDLMNQLRTTGKTTFSTIKSGLDGSLGIFTATLGGAGGFWDRVPKQTCTLARVDGQDVAYPILFNDRRVVLPAIHATCTNLPGRQIYISDDVASGVLLASFNPGEQSQGQMIEIRYPPPPPPSATGKTPTPKSQGRSGSNDLEQTLREKGKADIYGIYFDFDKDVIRPESEPVIRQIAEVMKANPSWKLNVNGHTDNIGGDAHNLDLSNRRAEAVKRVLVMQYGIDPARLATKGYGATQPKESNDTLEGRARNRRVELVRQ